MSGIYEAVLQALGGDPTQIQKDWAWGTACVLLVLGCWAIVKAAGWVIHR